MVYYFPHQRNVKFKKGLLSRFQGSCIQPGRKSTLAPRAFGSLSEYDKKWPPGEVFPKNPEWRFHLSILSFLATWRDNTRGAIT
jgi:hypothetical protein